MYYDDYIREQADETFHQSKAEIRVYDQDKEDVDGVLEDYLVSELFDGVMMEMVSYLYERQNELDRSGSMNLVFDPENVENIYVTARVLEPAKVIVEYEMLPEWFQMESAELREFYFYPNPALSGEWSAAYFQPR